MTKNKLITIRTTEDEQNAFYTACKRKGVIPSKILREYMNFVIDNPQFLTDEYNFTERENEREKRKSKKEKISYNDMENMLYGKNREVVPINELKEELSFIYADPVYMKKKLKNFLELQIKNGKIETHNNIIFIGNMLNKNIKYNLMESIKVNKNPYINGLHAKNLIQKIKQQYIDVGNIESRVINIIKEEIANNNIKMENEIIRIVNNDFFNMWS